MSGTSHHRQGGNGGGGNGGDVGGSDLPTTPSVAARTAHLSRNQRLWVLFKTYKGAFGIGAVALVLTNLLALRIPRELGTAVQKLEDASDGVRALADVVAEIPTHALLIIALAIGAALTRIWSRVKVFNVGRQIEYDLRNDLFAHLSKLSPDYYRSMATGDLTSRVINDTTYVRLLFGVAFLNIVNTAIAVVFAVSAMAALDWRLTVLCLGPFPIVLVLIWRMARALHIYTKRTQEKLADLSAQCQEDLSGVAVVKSYAVEDVESQRFQRQCDQYVDENMRLAKVRGTLFPLMMSIGGLGTLLVIYFGGRAVIVDQTIGVGQFIEFAGYIAHLTWPFMAMGWVLSVWQRGTAAFDRVAQVLDTEPRIVSPSVTEVEHDVKAGHLEFRDVTFRYGDAETPALEDVDLSIEPGRRVGIVGRSGAGKTTLVNLLTRLDDVDEGQIRIDGVPIKDIPLERLRHAIGYAPQEPFLFSTTLRKNVRFGLDAERYRSGRGGNGSTGGEVEEVLRAVHFDTDLDALPEGLETMVGERGITLSGGQKQRIALARALLRRPRILILDDSLSSVDTRTERAILEHLEEELAGRTALIVTHRFSVLELLDEIVVLDNGRLAERGSHEDLMAKGGLYADMVRRQKLKEELSAL